MMLPSGTRLGPYEIIGRIGAGGMGTVYKALDTRLNRTVAIKFLSEQLPHDPELLRRFDSEAKAVASLAHPHICVLHDVGEHAGERYLVMEYLEGMTLADRLAQGPLPQAQALRYAREIAQALSAAHRKGILHRDLKPSNVMLTKSGAKLVDFGLAKRQDLTAADADTSLTVPSGSTKRGIVVGTVPYMSPERLEGKPADARSDIFAFGAVLYEMLSGHRAFAGESAVFEKEPAPVSTVPPALDRLIRRCLAKDSDERWQSAQDLVEALGLISESSTSSSIATHEVPRRAWLRLAVPAILVAIVLSVSLFFRSLSTAPAPVVVLMDSTLPERVYDPDTREKGGTNSDDINDILRDLPLEIHKETTSADWRREDQVLRQRPTLVMVHLSSFTKPTIDVTVAQPEALERLRAFLGFVGLGNPDTMFIVYTRGLMANLDRPAWLVETEQRFQALKGRVSILHVPGGTKATFRDPATRTLVREMVVSTLGLPNK